MVDEVVSKHQGQRKRRNERESCINNVKLNVNLTSNREYSAYNCQQIDNSTYTKKPKKKLLQGSLENVSSNPWGDGQVDEQSSLRRSRSLAISRENLFSSLDFTRSGPNKLQQHQRRSQLIPRAKLIERTSSRQKVSSAENLDVYGRTIIKRKSPLTPPDYTPPESSPLKNQSETENIYYYPTEQNVNTNTNQPDSLDSNYHNKSSINSIFRLSYEELPGLSLPNYYPDSKYDTDNTDNVSLIDNISSVSLDNNNNNTKTQFNAYDGNEHDSISYDENIVLTTNKNLYESNKPKTIRGPTPYSENYFYSKNQPIYSSISDNDVAEKPPLLENSKNNTLSNYSNIEDNPLYEETKETTIKIEVEAADENTTEETDEQYKTVVTVESETVLPAKPIEKKTEIRKDKHHSHNYLKEFLETQKGSKKPLQNFIAKKFSNLSRRNSKDLNNTNLTNNQFHSLPDITISKNLTKCEKIDRKLRKCEKTNLSKSENRFIVNIGSHFDITADSSIPLDFEVKIAKVPKKNKHKSDEQLIEAVKNLKETLHGSYNNLNDSKPEIVAVKPKSHITDEEEMSTPEEDKKEFHEKLGSMRNYWKKLITPKEAITEETAPPKIVDVQTKVEDVKKKFEPPEPPPEKPPNKVQLAKQLFEPKQDKHEKLSPFIKETCNYFESNQFESLNPNIVEIIDKKEIQPKKKQHKPVSKSKSITYPEFDHVRYRVVKSDLFQKKIFANCEKESQFDGLMQYLQDYSFQELLIDNNIVIIEPIRTKIQYEKKQINNQKNTPRNITPLLHSNQEHDDDLDGNSKLRRHFFYHPIRVNKEVNDDELPNPDTVRQARQFFEGGLKRSQSNQELLKEQFITSKGIDPDKDRCSATDSSNISDFSTSQENLYDSIGDSEEHCCEQQYVSEDILEKIRECGTTVTYYGGRVVKKQTNQPILTKAIMEEIKNNEKRYTDCNCRRNSDTKEYQGVKFRLVKSNSCSSRLELVGTNSLDKSKKKFFLKQKQLLRENNNNGKKFEENNNSIKEVTIENETIVKVRSSDDKNAINESIKRKNSNQPKIIAEERKLQNTSTNNKLTQWGDVNKEKTYASITFNEKPSHKLTYDYRNYDKIKTKTKNFSDMEFEPYEVA